MKSAGAVVTFFLLAATAADAQRRGRQPDQTGVKYRAWQATMAGNAISNAVGVPGTKLDADVDLDMEREKLFHDLTIWGQLPAVDQGRVNYWEGSLSGSNPAPNAFTFGGQIFDGSEPISTKYEFTSISVRWDHPVASQQIGLAGSLDAAVQFGYQYFSILGDVSTATKTGRGHARAPFATFGLRIFSQLADWLYTDIETTFNFFPLVDDVDGQYRDVTVELLINPFERLFVGAGYRRSSIEIRDDRHGTSARQKLDIVLDGYFFSIQYYF